MFCREKNQKTNCSNQKKLRLTVAFAFVFVLLLTAVFAGWLTPYDPYEQDLSRALLPPGSGHLLGTDRYGRDLMSRVISGARASVFSSLVLVAVTLFLGSVIGICCGYLGGWLDALLMRISDVFFAFPGMVFAIAAAGIFAGGIKSAVFALVLTSWPKYARLARGQVLSLKEETFIQAARFSGNTTVQIIFRHILPNIAGTLIVTAALDMGTMLMELSGLSFLGLGAASPTAEWGAMMSEGKSLLQTAPWVVLAPGAAIFLTVTIWNLFGEALRDYLDV